MTARSVFLTMPDPDDVGASEYRVLHSHLTDVIASTEIGGASDDDALEQVIASLDELIDQARTTRRQFVEAAARSTLARDVLALDEELSRVLALPKDDGVRRGVELHGKMRRILKLIEQMPAGHEKEQAQTLSRAFLQRLITELFGMDASAVKDLV